MTVTILLITNDLHVLSTTSDAFLTDGAFTTSPQSPTDDHAIETACKLVEAGKPTCIGYPPTWPRSLVARLLKAASERCGQLAAVPTSLLAAYGCAKGNAIAVQVSDKDGPVTVSAVVDWQPVTATTTTIDTIDLSTITLLNDNIEADKRAAVMDNLIVTGTGWTPDVERQVLAQVQRLATVSTFPGDLQVRAVNVRHCPEYHVEVLRCVSVERMQPVVAIFGATISCRALLTESSR